MTTKIKIACLASVLALTTACSYEFPTQPEPAAASAGNANFSKHVAIGDFAVAGYADGALYEESQNTSFPALMSQSMASLNGGVYVSPILPGANGFNPTFSVPSLGIFVGRLKLVLPTCTKSSMTARPQLPGVPPGPYTGDLTKLTNFGVPGMKITESLFPGYGSLNAFYGRFASSVSSSTAVGDARNAGGTFFTMWLGNHDILGYATAGGAGNAGGGTGPTDMTDGATFGVAFTSALDIMLSSTSGTKGAVGNIPDVTDMPYFTAVNASLLSSKKIPFALDSATASQLNFLYTLQGMNNPNFIAGTSNMFTIQTAAGVRQMNPSNDLLLLSLPTDSLGTGPVDPCNPTGPQRAGWGVTKPIANQYVLDQVEVSDVLARTAAFNASIKSAVDTKNTSGVRVALVDMNTFMKTLKTTGIKYGTTTLKLDVPFGNVISLDGINPTPKGSAVYANKFIDVINASFGANVYRVDPTTIRGNEIP